MAMPTTLSAIGNGTQRPAARRQLLIQVLPVPFAVHTVVPHEGGLTGACTG